MLFASLVLVLGFIPQVLSDTSTDICLPQDNMRPTFLLFSGLGACAAAGKGDDFAAKCAGFKSSLKLPNTKVWFTEHVPAGKNITFPDNHPTCTPKSTITDVEICRVAMFVTTGPKSNLTLEAWLPSNWTGRFLSTGNGGMAGCIQYDDVAYGAGFGFATVGANNGHNGTSAVSMYKNSGVVEDYVYRSVHTGTVLGKELTKKFYGKKHTKSYYLGCSTGGRQGWKEAQSFPDDFDGIVAGAPAMRFNGLQSRSGSFWGITGPPGAPTHLSPEEWAMVQKNVLVQCDEPLDGVADGILEDPNLCQYRPEALVCSKGQTKNCLTGPQIETVRKVFGPLYGNNGTYIYPRIPPGADQGFGFAIGEQPFPYSTEWFQYVIWNDTKWDPNTIGPNDYQKASEVNPFNVETWEGDLSKFRKRGSKIIHWHGLEDGLISSDNSMEYYNHVSATMGLSNTELDEFYRYFRVSGCGHCSGGIGANRIGNNRANLGGKEAKNNVLLALVKWVEEGQAPETITGVRYVNGATTGKVEVERRHCRYPYRNVWDRKGNYKNPDSWKCELPK
ncbi:feruloyl esterase [Fusarium oxysporum f. sp. pisi HDV247]|uniref:Carboxylic ester hydrolase n=1 Tax=Fusarium oxysporum f. sp. pisi HDV247 TaxID=1080344 RepID=W9NXZ3_FUSOX|nr:feruloyl esterase [Fusarium oxysporum f. sp. pisi HDV247]WKT53057.1 Tannase/feruloyl esterase [Fusarium oxysporum f. sp. vasinfectum]